MSLWALVAPSAPPERSRYMQVHSKSARRACRTRQPRFPRRLRGGRHGRHCQLRYGSRKRGSSGDLRKFLLYIASPMGPTSGDRRANRPKMKMQEIAAEARICLSGNYSRHPPCQGGPGMQVQSTSASARSAAPDSPAFPLTLPRLPLMASICQPNGRLEDLHKNPTCRSSPVGPNLGHGERIDQTVKLSR